MFMLFDPMIPAVGICPKKVITAVLKTAKRMLLLLLFTVMKTTTLKYIQWQNIINHSASIQEHCATIKALVPKLPCVSESSGDL